MKTFRTALAALVFVAGLQAAGETRAAVINLSTNGGAACKPAYGASTSFAFRTSYAENIGTTDQYVVCHFPNWDLGPPQGLESLQLYMTAGAYPGTVVCVAGMGYYYNTTHFTSVLSKSVTVASAGQGGVIEYLGGELPDNGGGDESLTLNCKLPRGFKFGLIRRTQLEPGSGYGWIP